jgi:hypothetical protein
MFEIGQGKLVEISFCNRSVNIHMPSLVLHNQTWKPDYALDKFLFKETPLRQAGPGQHCW